MSVKIGSFTPGVTGDATITGLTFLPTNIQVRLGAVTGSIDTVSRACHGWATTSNQSYDAFYQDTTGGIGRAGTDKIIRHYSRVSGTITEVVTATFVSFNDNGGGNYGFTLNFTAVNANFQVRFKVSDE